MNKDKEQKTYLIYGISRGLGKAITRHLPEKNDFVYGISRSEPSYLNEYKNVSWISADLSKPTHAADTIKAKIKNEKIDYLIYNVGIWEEKAFTDEYDFNQTSQEEIIQIVNTNISSCILNIKAMLDNLKQSKNAKIILIGSTWGLDNHLGKEVAFSASKFALRGVVHSMRENLREDNIGVSILNLGYLATEFDFEEDIDCVISKTNGNLIPLQDVIQALKFITSTSIASCVKEINMPAMGDLNM